MKSVFWNGRALCAHPARVSARPLNKVWNGAQRPVEQTRVVSFVSFDMDAPGTLEIRDVAECGAPVFLPLGSAPEWRRECGVLRVAIDRPRQFVVSFPDGEALHVFANPPFGEGAATRQQGATAAPRKIRRFGPGEHHVGVVVAESDETIVIEEGAVVYGTVLVANAHDVRVVGRGIIDGSFLDRASHGSVAFRAAVAAGMTTDQYGAEMAVNGITVWNSERVAVEGVVVRDPPRWTLIVRGGSRDVEISNVKIVGCWRYNSDGINVCASENVAIRDCFVRSFDDCLVARGKYLDGDGYATRNVTAERCVLWCDWGKCMEVWAGHLPCLIEGIRFRDIAVVHPSGPVCDVTTWFASDDTRIRDVSFEDIEVDFALPLFNQEIDNEKKKGIGGVEPREVLELFVANTDRYGRNLGNQHHEAATDLSGFHVRYENLAFRRFTILRGAVPAAPALVARIDATTSPHTIDGVALEGLPQELSLKIAGSVANVSGTAPAARQSDAARMGAEAMNPGTSLGTSERVSGGAFKVLIYGNSIALHRPKADIGWTSDWGMAASAPEKDFAHLVVAGLEAKRGEKANFRIRNLAPLERDVAADLRDFPDIAADIAWKPDYVVIAIGENVPHIDEEPATVKGFERLLVSLARPFAEGGARVVLRTPFWRNENKAGCTKRAAEKTGVACVDAGPLGDDPENKAIGLFAHRGVAAHPGDLGMRRIADLILEAF